jgi:hypothetical protein
MRAIKVVVGVLLIGAGLLAGFIGLYILNGEARRGPWGDIVFSFVAAAALIGAGGAFIAYGVRRRRADT